MVGLSNMLLFGTLIIGSVVIVFLISSFSTGHDNRNADRERELINSIESKTIELDSLTKQVENNKVDKDVNLSNLIVNVLDIYAKSSIVIPLDIIEELSYNQYETAYDVFSFIEQQRNHWKLENTKRPYKKVKP